MVFSCRLCAARLCSLLQTSSRFICYGGGSSRSPLVAGRAYGSRYGALVRKSTSEVAEWPWRQRWEDGPGVYAHRSRALAVKM